MKIIAISDLHGHLPKINQEADLLLICGDLVPLEVQNNDDKSLKWFTKVFKPWAITKKVNKVIFIAGNHDFFCERNPEKIKELFPITEKVSYLFDSLYVFSKDNVKINIYGTPYCKQFGKWAFMYDLESLYSKYYKNIPENIDILMCHDAPTLGSVGIIHDNNYKDLNCSNMALALTILQKKPRYVLCGHIHSGNHNIECIDGINIVNVSILDEHYKVNYKPFEFDFGTTNLDYNNIDKNIFYC